MSPEKASDPEKGKPAEDEQIEASAGEPKDEAGKERAPERKRPRIRRKAARAATATTPDEAADEKAPDEADDEKAADEAAVAQAASEEPADGSADAPTPKPAAKKGRARSAAGAESKAAKPAAGADSKAAKPAARASAKPAARAGRRGGKPARRRVVRARARYVRTSARKARMVCGHLRGKTVPEARAILAFTPREVARDWSKLLESAVANAESNHELLEDDLIVREAYADEGPTIKRFRPRAMGRATPIQKRTSHLTITLIPGP